MTESTMRAEPANAKFRAGDRVRKVGGSEWEGRIVGNYSTAQTPEGYAVESAAHAGSVQIYPAKALMLATPAVAEATAPSTERPPFGPRPIFEPEGSDVQFTLSLMGNHIPETTRKRIEAALAREFAPKADTPEALSPSEPPEGEAERRMDKPSDCEVHAFNCGWRSHAAVKPPAVPTEDIVVRIVTAASAYGNALACSATDTKTLKAELICVIRDALASKADTPEPKCKTCGGHGLIGGFVSDGDGGGGYDSELCPDCTPEASSPSAPMTAEWVSAFPKVAARMLNIFAAKIDKLSEGKPCTLPPEGWTCSRPDGHDGPCAAIPEMKADTPEAPSPSAPSDKQIKSVFPPRSGLAPSTRAYVASGGAAFRAVWTEPAMLEFAHVLLARFAATPKALTVKQIEKGWHETFSTNNPFCPCDLRTFTKAVNWAQRAILAAHGGA